MPKRVRRKFERKARVARQKTRPRRKAARRSQAIGAALADLAHDIRTPLTGIVAMCR